MQEAEKGTYLNLINMQQGRHSLSYETFDEVPAMQNVEVIINKELSRVSAPLGDKFTLETANGKTKIILERLDIHTVLLLEE